MWGSWSFKLASQAAEALAVLDKSLFLPPAELIEALAVGRYDVSGDFSPGLGVKSGLVSKLVNELVGCASLSQGWSFDVNSAYLAIRDSNIGVLGVRELVGSWAIIQAAGLHLLFDVKPLLSRGLSYYNGSVIELSSSVVCLNARNCFVKIGSLMGGGRYDNFLKAGAGVGCSFGVTRAVDYYTCLKRNFCGFNRLAIICVCWWHTSSFDEGLMKSLCSLSALGFRLKLVAGVQFGSAIRRAKDCDLLLYRSGNGWICKNLIKRRRLQSKLQATVLWRELFIDQFWVSDCRCDLEVVEMSRACLRFGRC
ncbi:MAG: hypothetical protein ACKFI0_00375 [Candidatus Hodgkinia cicadicola]